MPEDAVALGNSSLAYLNERNELCIRVGANVATLDDDQRQRFAALATRCDAGAERPSAEQTAAIGREFAATRKRLVQALRDNQKLARAVVCLADHPQAYKAKWLLRAIAIARAATQRAENGGDNAEA